MHKGLWVLVGSPGSLSVPLQRFSQEELCLCSSLCLIQLSWRKCVLGIAQKQSRGWGGNKDGSSESCAAVSDELWRSHRLTYPYQKFPRQSVLWLARQFYKDCKEWTETYLCKNSSYLEAQWAIKFRRRATISWENVMLSVSKLNSKPVYFGVQLE